MSISRIHFQRAPEAAAFELGLWFYCPPPFSTTLDGTALVIRDNYGGDGADHEYRWTAISNDTAAVDVGEGPLVSSVVFHTVYEAQAFASGVSWLSGAFVSISVSETLVTVSESRADGEDAGVLVYEYAQLRSLIAAYRSDLQPDPASA